MTADSETEVEVGIAPDIVVFEELIVGMVR